MISIHKIQESLATCLQFHSHDPRIRLADEFWVLVRLTPHRELIGGVVMSARSTVRHLKKSG
jgi:hypothetical protein